MANTVSFIPLRLAVTACGAPAGPPPGPGPGPRAGPRADPAPAPAPAPLRLGRVRHVRHRIVAAGGVVAVGVGVSHGDPGRERRRQVVSHARARQIARHVIRWRLIQETTIQTIRMTWRAIALSARP